MIDSLEIEFPKGLVIITGQTGAGKSILLGALSLVLGAKADASHVSSGADNCVVEAEFDTCDAVVKEILEDNEAEWEGGHLIIRRVVNRSGRSRAFVNDSPVPVAVLQSLSSRLVDVHSQHQTMLLSDHGFQLEILDHFAGTSGLREECAAAWRKLGKYRAELAELEKRLASLKNEHEYNEAQFRQLDAAGLRAGELAELEEEQKQLANAGEIKSGLCAAEEIFTASSSDGEHQSVDAALKEADKLLARVGRFIPAAAELAERVASCRMELDDIASEVSSMNASLDSSGDRLEQVEERMSFLYGLLQKHSCTNEEELVALRDSLSGLLLDTTRIEEERDELSALVSDSEQTLSKIADELSMTRRKAAQEFASGIAATIRSMELPYSVFEVELSDAPVSSSGHDAISFRFSSSGKNPVDVAKCASGGEMSRIMLALKAMMARFANMPTMIFDEIDTGVSGSVADKMGSVICDMGQNMQVFAITHLPQVAAKGTAHYLVSKEIDPETSTAVSTIKKLSDDQRVLEVARMLSGSVLTDAAIANAKALLKG
ncbi:MAG: DNA repair protein RecN [Bacteroidales bacterium]|nr:DNA repair protein RecN [Bacteroidales bacterium]